MTDFHTAVLGLEVVALLPPQPGDTVVDGTAGGGGHALLIAPQLGEKGRLALIDQDPDALDEAQSALAGAEPQVIPLRGNFRDMAALLRGVGITEVNAVLLDLGVSSHQLDRAERGFSFRQDGPLDMRMSPEAGESAAELLARAPAEELERILHEYGEERWARRITDRIVRTREAHPIETTGELAALVSGAIPRKFHPRDIHPATRSFMGIRIAVNDELGALRQGLEAGIGLLRAGGRIAVISYHSLEDRIVKQAFLRLSGRCICEPGKIACECGAVRMIEILTKKPVVAGAEEIRQNPRARSAKLRAARRVIV